MATETQTTAPPPPATAGPNLLPNPSFENGWYHINGIPELQIPNQWTLEWDEGLNPLDPDPWNRFVRPECRVLSTDFLPASEHPLFIWNGAHTVKIFKGTGALSFRLLTNVTLQPGSYVLEVSVFPDLVNGYTPSGEKVWAPDPLSGELRFIAGSPMGGWVLPSFGQKNTLRQTFDVVQESTLQIGMAFRGRWAILNNGWFMDDWSLRRVSG